MSEIVEVKTKAAAEKAIAAGHIVKIVAGTFALSVNVNATIIVAGNASPSIETWGTSAPSIVTRGTSAPRINENSASIPLIYLSGLRWRVTISDTRMAIGCQEHDLSRWWSFSDAQISAMDREYALPFWNAHKPTLQALCQATGRPFAMAEMEAAQ